MTISATPKKPFAGLPLDGLMNYCRSLYVEHGIEALTYTFLRAHHGLYFTLHRHGIKPRILAEKLGLEEEYQAHLTSRSVTRNGKEIDRWTWAKIVQVARSVTDEQGFLPAAAWFQANGYGSLVQAVYYTGYNWENLRCELDDFDSSQFIQSRNGIRWRSHPEASLSNFLYARSIEHKRGERYPDDYSDFSGRAYGYYDLHFKGRSGWIDVEIWGDKPKGHGKTNYSNKRQLKEQYNKQNSRFLGIQFQDCFDDATLTRILSEWVKVPEPYIFERPTDSQIQSSHWSNADELLAFCQHLADEMPDGKFPTEEWLRKRGKWKDRPGDTYNTASVYIKKWLGGIRNLRRLLGQGENSTLQWDRSSALEAWRSFYEEHGQTASQIRTAYTSDPTSCSIDLYRLASRIDAAVLKYVGGTTTANDELGIGTDRTRTWTREAIIEGYRRTFDKWGLSPSQVLYDAKKGRIDIPEHDRLQLTKMIDATTRKFQSANEVYELIDRFPPSRPRTRHSKRSSGSTG